MKEYQGLLCPNVGESASWTIESVFEQGYCRYMIEVCLDDRSRAGLRSDMFNT